MVEYRQAERISFLKSLQAFILLSLPKERYYFWLPVSLCRAYSTVMITRLFVTLLLEQGVLVPSNLQSGAQDRGGSKALL